MLWLGNAFPHNVIYTHTPVRPSLAVYRPMRPYTERMSSIMRKRADRAIMAIGASWAMRGIGYYDVVLQVSVFGDLAKWPSVYSARG